MSDDVHEVYAVRYASHARKRSENYIFGDPHDEMTSISYYVWAIKGPHGTFVCDTGFDQAAANERGRKIIKPIDRLPPQPNIRIFAAIDRAGDSSALTIAHCQCPFGTALETSVAPGRLNSSASP